MKPTVVVLAAGLGTRYGGVKQIDPVGAHGETLLDYSVFDAARSGFGRVVFVIRRDIEKDFRERIFDRIAANLDAVYVFQTHDSLLTADEAARTASRTKPWGTVHAVLCAEGEVRAPFVVVNADDFYGRASYETMGRHLSSLDASSTDHAMVGYKLRNTMSPSGSVSRGVCHVRDGFLADMRENTKIEYAADGTIVSHLPEGDCVLTGDETVSMNFFGFTPAAFASFHRFFDDFKRTSLLDPKAESLLPEAASRLVLDGEGRIRVFGTPERWFGMTHHGDRETVRLSLARKTAEGAYPERLWERG